MRHTLSFSRLLAIVVILLTLTAAGAVFNSPGPAEAQDVFFLSFGKGKVKVRLYADYFCSPCRSLEPQIEPVLADLVRRNVISLTFIDAPFHKYSSLYAQYFLYVVNENKEFGHILASRAILFEGAKARIEEKEKLEEFLSKKGLKFKAFDVKPSFAALQGLMREDRIDATPTCVIFRGGKKEYFKGGTEIAQALQNIR